MKTEDAARALMALGHEKRLDVFRMLVQAGHNGVSISDIQSYHNIPASTLAHHLAILLDGGLIKQEKQGRKTICIALYKEMQSVFDFVTHHCCQGVELGKTLEPVEV